MNCGRAKWINRNGFASEVVIIVIMLTLPLACPNALAQTTTAFGPSTKFSVTAYNGVINFAVNGTYSTAAFEGNNWVFTNLQLNRSQLLENLEISAKNSNVTVNFYRVTTVNFPSSRISLSVQGKGQQVVNMGVGVRGGSKVDWVVTSNGTFLNQGWSVSQNGTVTITGLTGNISVIYFGFTSQLGSSNLPFYEQHSVAIAVAIGLAATVAAAVVVKVAVKKQANEEESKNA